MRLIFLLASTLLLCGCMKHNNGPDTDWMYADRVRVDFATDDATMIIQQFVTELHYEKRLNLESAFMCIGDHGQKIRIEFTTQALLMLCEARELMSDIVEGVLYNINTKLVDPVQKPQPYTSADLEIYIKFESFYGEYDDPFYIGWIAMEENMVYYYAFNLDNRKLRSWSTHYEPYPKTKSIAHAQREAEKEYKLSHKKPSPLGNLDIRTNH